MTTENEDADNAGCAIVLVTAIVCITIYEVFKLIAPKL